MLVEQFPRLLREHQDMVYSIALRVAGDRGAAEEIAQDVFLELHGKLNGLESEDHVKYWLRRVASHRAIDNLRRQTGSNGHGSREVGMDEATLEALAERAAETASLREPGDPVLNRQLQQLLSSLPAVQRSVLTLRYQEEQSPDEIAGMLGMPVATVKSHLQRALKLLRTKLLRTKAERILR